MAHNRNSRTQNPYAFNTFNLDGDNSAKLETCHLQYGCSHYPQLDYEGDDETRIHHDLIGYRYRKNDYNTGTQLNVANYKTLLNEASNAHDYKIFAVVLNEEEFVLKEIGNELVVG